MKADFEESDIIPEDETGSGAEALKKLRERLKSCLADKQDYLDGWQRSRADFANLKKEEAARRDGLRVAVTEEFAEKFIPIIDTFEAAMSDTGWKETDRSWRTGLEGIHKELVRALESLEVAPFDPVGERFDPASHIVAGREGAEEGETIIRVERKGYRLRNKVLRPAYVVLGFSQ